MAENMTGVQTTDPVLYICDDSTQMMPTAQPSSLQTIYMFNDTHTFLNTGTCHERILKGKIFVLAVQPTASAHYIQTPTHTNTTL